MEVGGRKERGHARYNKRVNVRRGKRVECAGGKNKPFLFAHTFALNYMSWFPCIKKKC